MFRECLYQSQVDQDQTRALDLWDLFLFEPAHSTEQFFLHIAG